MIFAVRKSIFKATFSSIFNRPIFYEIVKLSRFFLRLFFNFFFFKRHTLESYECRVTYAKESNIDCPKRSFRSIYILHRTKIRSIYMYSNYKYIYTARLLSLLILANPVRCDFLSLIYSLIIA